MKRLSAKQYANRLWQTWSVTPVAQHQVLLTTFLTLLQRQRALKLAPRIVEQLQRLEDEKNGVQRVRVATASAVDEQTLRTQLTKIFGPVALDVTVNPALVAGLKIQVGDQSIDGSVASQLRRLQTHLSHA